MMKKAASLWSEQMLMIVTYDIADNKRRSGLASTLKNYGQRVQKSVFECWLEETQIIECKRDVEKIMDASEDSVRYYYLCEKDGAKVKHIGSAVVYKDEDYFMI